MSAVPGHVPAYYRRKIEHFFASNGRPVEGRQWLAAIPARVRTYAERWDLDVEPPFEGLSYNYVAPATRADGSQAVLKIGLPEPEQRSEILALRHYAGDGIARLLEDDLEGYTALTERLVPGTPLSTYYPERDDEATAIASRVLRALLRPAPDDVDGFGSVEGWARRGMQELRATFDGGTGPFPAHLVERAERLFDELLDSTTTPMLIHGDYHHMNVLYSNERGWLAIDPKGIIGDAAFDCSAFLLNPIPNIRTAPEYRALTRRRVDILAEVTGLDRQRIIGWAQAFAVLSGWWSYDEIGSWKPTIALAEELAKL